jgi:hypothetical protein
MKQKQKLPIRLAFREEGRMWNVYLARPGTMEGAALISSIAIGAVDGKGKSKFKRMYISLMEQILANMIEDAIGKVPGWEVTPAPESERGGHA